MRRHCWRFVWMLRCVRLVGSLEGMWNGVPVSLISRTKAETAGESNKAAQPDNDTFISDGSL